MISIDQKATDRYVGHFSCYDVFRGAELINRILVHGVTRQKEKEAEILEGIKKKMHALKERQSKLRKDYQEPEEHFQGSFSYGVKGWGC